MIQATSKMVWLDYVGYSLIVIVIICQVTALVLLHTDKHTVRNQNPLYLIKALLFFEMGTHFFYGACFLIGIKKRIVLITLNVFAKSFISLTYFGIMTLLVLDRFLAFYLNIKYLVICTKNRIKKIVIALISVISALSTLLIILVIVEIIDLTSTIVVLMKISLVFDLIYITLCIATYIYIFTVFKRQMKIRKMGSALQDRFKLLVPTLVIATFIFFIIIPEIVDLFSGYRYPINTIAEILYSIGFLCDPIIYVCNYKCTSKKIMRSKRREFEPKSSDTKVEKETILSLETIEA